MSDPSSSLYQRYQGVKRRLIQLRDIGKIEVRFSTAHVLEMAHTERRFRDAAMRRVETMLEICGQRVLLDPPTLHLLDMTYLPLKRRGRWNKEPFPRYAYDNNGDWFANLRDEDVDLKKTLQDELERMLSASAATRQQRRLVKRMFSKDGKIPPQLRSYLKAYQDKVRDGLKQELPITDRFYSEDMILAFALGEMTEQEVTAELKKGFTDVKNFVGTYIDRYDEMRPTFQKIIKIQTEAEKRIAGIREQISDSWQAAEAAGLEFGGWLKMVRKHDLDIAGVRAKQLRRYFNIIENTLEGMNISDQEWEEYVVNSDFWCIPSWDCYLSILRRYFLDVGIYMNRDGRFPKQKRSDAGDLVHAYYVPYVDVFRADRRFARYLTHAATAFGTCIVSDADRLIPEIENLIA